MNSIDRQILSLLQEDATYTAGEIAERVGLTSTPCWRRIQKLEQAGYIRGRVALLDRDKLNIGVTVFVSIRTSRHTKEWLEGFKRGIRSIPEIVEAHRLGGDIDYLLRVVVPNIEGFDQVYKQLIEVVEFSDVSSSFSMEEMKSTTALPLDYA
jgi:Lrp/AsnC family transcriptional regulator